MEPTIKQDYSSIRVECDLGRAHVCGALASKVTAIRHNEETRFVDHVRSIDTEDLKLIDRGRAE